MSNLALGIVTAELGLIVGVLLTFIV